MVSAAQLGSGIHPIQQTGKGNSLPDMMQAAEPGYHALDAHAKPRVRHAAVLPQVEVPARLPEPPLLDVHAGVPDVDAARTGGKFHRQLLARLNFRQVDACPEDTLNRIIWHAVKGPSAPYPAWAVTLVEPDD